MKLKTAIPYIIASLLWGTVFAAFLLSAFSPPYAKKAETDPHTLEMFPCGKVENADPQCRRLTVRMPDKETCERTAKSFELAKCTKLNPH
jgi:hypothetical protein